MKRTILGVLFVGLVATPLLARDATGRIGIGAAGGWDDLWARKDDRRTTNGDLFGSLWVRLGLTKRNELVFGYDSLQFKVKDDSSANRMRIRPITVGLWHSFWADKQWTPFATIGVGGADLRWRDSSGATVSHSGVAAQGGVGVEYFPLRLLSVGALARAHYVVNKAEDARTEATAYSLGLMANLFWGGEAPPAPIEEPVGEVPVIVPPPLDSDGDGVIDTLDKCPQTPEGALVNDVGCPIEKVSVSLDLKFATGKTDLGPESDAPLFKVAEFLKKHPGTTEVIEGHTDNVGSPIMNKRLSQKRADAVRTALVERFGVPADQITAKGFGADSPIESNATPEGRAANRRVVAVISAQKK